MHRCESSVPIIFHATPPHLRSNTQQKLLCIIQPIEGVCVKRNRMKENEKDGNCIAKPCTSLLQNIHLNKDVFV